MSFEKYNSRIEPNTIAYFSKCKGEAAQNSDRYNWLGPDATIASEGMVLYLPTSQASWESQFNIKDIMQ